MTIVQRRAVPVVLVPGPGLSSILLSFVTVCILIPYLLRPLDCVDLSTFQHLVLRLNTLLSSISTIFAS